MTRMGRSPADGGERLLPIYESEVVAAPIVSEQQAIPFHQLPLSRPGALPTTAARSGARWVLVASLARLCLPCRRSFSSSSVRPKTPPTSVSLAAIEHLSIC